jgi:hypothetical protein
MFAAEPPPDADFLCYYSGPNVMVEPRNSAAKQCLDTTLDGNALAWRNGAAIVETSAVVPLVHKLIAAGFNVVGQSAGRVRDQERAADHRQLEVMISCHLACSLGGVHLGSGRSLKI